MTFLPDKVGIYCNDVALFAAMLVFLRIHLQLYPRGLSDSDFQGGRDYVLQLVEWERDRILTIAKGIAGTAVTYFAALIPLIFKDKLSANVSGLAVLGTVLGFLGSLVFACDMTIATTQFVRDPETVRKIGSHNDG